MREGVCIAGVSAERSNWIRPVKRRGSIVASDLVARDKRVLRPLDLVEFELFRSRGQRPHIEDCLADFLVHPVVKERPSDAEREGILERLAERSPDVVVVEKKRSLILVEPDSLAARVGPAYGGVGVEVRITFALSGDTYDGESSRRGYPCTDLRFLAWAATLGSSRAFSDVQLRQALGARRMFLALGLSREFQGNYWPMVVGVHTCPDFAGEIDLGNL